jgi:hypothetical protein
MGLGPRVGETSFPFYKCGYFIIFTTPTSSGQKMTKQTIPGTGQCWCPFFEVGRPFPKLTMLIALTATGAVAAVVSLNF